MHPILTTITIGDAVRPIGTYGVLLSLGILVTGGIAVRAAARSELDVGATIATVGFAAAGGIVGAVTLFAIVSALQTGDVLAGIRSPGLVFLGSPIGAGAAYAFFTKKVELPALRLLDLAIVGVPLGHAVGRVGCFFGGCCYGAPTDLPWAIRYTHPLAPATPLYASHHPTPLYESAGLLVLAAIFALTPIGRVGTGERALAYGAAYGVLRVATETFRGDAIRGGWGIASTSQILGGLLAVGCAALLVRIRWLERARR